MAYGLNENGTQRQIQTQSTGGMLALAQAAQQRQADAQRDIMEAPILENPLQMQNANTPVGGMNSAMNMGNQLFERLANRPALQAERAQQKAAFELGEINRLNTEAWNNTSQTQIGNLGQLTEAEQLTNTLRHAQETGQSIEQITARSGELANMRTTFGKPTTEQNQSREDYATNIKRANESMQNDYNRVQQHLMKQLKVDPNAYRASQNKIYAGDEGWQAEFDKIDKAANYSASKIQKAFIAAGHTPNLADLQNIGSATMEEKGWWNFGDGVAELGNVDAEVKKYLATRNAQSNSMTEIEERLSPMRQEMEDNATKWKRGLEAFGTTQSTNQLKRSVGGETIELADWGKGADYKINEDWERILNTTPESIKAAKDAKAKEALLAQQKIENEVKRKEAQSAAELGARYPQYNKDKPYVPTRKHGRGMGVVPEYVHEETVPNSSLGRKVRRGENTGIDSTIHAQGQQLISAIGGGVDNLINASASQPVGGQIADFANPSPDAVSADDIDFGMGRVNKAEQLRESIRKEHWAAKGIDPVTGKKISPLQAMQAKNQEMDLGWGDKAMKKAVEYNKANGTKLSPDDLTLQSQTPDPTKYTPPSYADGELWTAESGKDGYDSVAGETTQDATSKTVGELLNRSANVTEDFPRGTSAIGKYQFMNVSFKEIVEDLNIPSDAKFTPELQDRMFKHYALKQPAIRKYVANLNKGTQTVMQRTSAIEAFTKKWAGFKNEGGKGAYDGFNGNSATADATTVDKILQSLAAS